MILIYFLIIMVVVLLFYAYFLTGRDILSPWFISCAMYLLSICTVAVNSSLWSIEISIETVYVIMLALISFGIGELIIRYTFQKKNIKNNNFRVLVTKPINIPTRYIVLINCVMLIVLYWYFIETYRLSLLGGNPGGYELMLKYARSASVTHSINPVLTLLLAGCTSISYVLLFVILYNIIFFGKKSTWRLYAIPILIYVGQLIITTGRQSFIQLMTTIVIMLFVLISIKGNRSLSNKKMIYTGLFAIVFFVAVFFALGFLTDKSFLGFSTTISLYMGGSIVGLDYYLQNPISDSNIFGVNTLFGVYSSLAQLGINVPHLYAPLEFFYIGNHGVNIYTPLRRYIQDYSFTGMLFIQLILGMLYSSALMYLRRQNKISVFIIIFAMFYYPIVESAIEERFFMLVFSFNAAFKACGVVFFYWLFKLYSKINAVESKREFEKRNNIALKYK